MRIELNATNIPTGDPSSRWRVAIMANVGQWDELTEDNSVVVIAPTVDDAVRLFNFGRPGNTYTRKQLIIDYIGSAKRFHVKPKSSKLATADKTRIVTSEDGTVEQAVRNYNALFAHDIACDTEKAGVLQEPLARKELLIVALS